MSSNSGLFDLLKEALEFSQALGFAIAANLALLVYDICLTLNTEIEFIWKAPWSSMKIIYLITRYLIFVDSILELAVVVLPRPSERTCLQTSQTIQLIYTIGVLSGT
ncbi:hypothetical protein BDQ17DRAFT_819998 [Cyathus striatus]|nr:hypothetical protein BDQ17DRAFT_819998 [Cyathus striatus]